MRPMAVYGTDDAKTIRAITQAGNDVAESEKRKKIGEIKVYENEGGFGGRRGGFSGGSGGRGFDRGPREMHKAVCTECGAECEVPFKPTEGKPVYCRDCWQKKRGF